MNGLFDKKQAAFDGIIDAWEAFQGKKYQMPEFAEYRRYLLKILSRSPFTWVRIEKETKNFPFADFNLDELFKPIDI